MVNRVLRNILIGIGGSIAGIVIVALLVRDPIAKHFVQKIATERWGAPVHVQRLHLALLKPGVSIHSLFIDSKDDASLYTATVGLIDIRIKLWPYISGKFIDIPILTLQDVQFNVPKDASATAKQDPETPGALEELQSLTLSINIEKAVSDYLKEYGSTLTSINSVNRVLSQSQAIGESVSQTIQSSSDDLKNLRNDAEELQKRVTALQDLSDMTQLRRVLQQSLTVSSNIRDVYDRGTQDYKALAGSIARIEALSTSLLDSIREDSSALAKRLISPGILGTSLTQGIVRQMLEEPATRYHGILENVYKNLGSIGKKNTDSAKDSKDEKSVPDFAVGVFNLNINTQDYRDLIRLQAQNITSDIYMGPPTSFTILSNVEGISIEGKGAFSLNEDIPEFVSADLSGTRIPVDLRKHISAMELQRLAGKLDGSLSFSMDKDTSMLMDASVSVGELAVQAIPGSPVGVYAAPAIEKAQPIELAAHMAIDGGQISDFRITSPVFRNLVDYAADIAREHIAKITEDAEAYAFQYIRTQTDTSLADARNYVEPLQEPLSGIVTEAEQIDSVAQNAKEQIEQHIREIAGEKIQKGLEQSAEKLKNFLSF